MNKRHFLLLCIFCLCACSRQKGRAIIDLTDIGQNEIVVPAESIYSSIKFIPLETHGQSILSSPNVFGMDGDNVLIWDQDEILRFQWKIPEQSGTVRKRTWRTRAYQLRQL